MSNNSPAASTSCQKQIVKNESFNSFYFEVHSSTDFGRYLVAKEDIDEKTLILSETPLVFGPVDDKDLENDLVFLFCLACCKQLFPNEEVVLEQGSDFSDDDYEHDQCGSGSSRSSSSRGSFSLYYCSKCGWPVCDTNCEKSPVHSNFECKFFNLLHHDRSTYPPPHMWLMYKTVILLRLLLLIQRDPQNTWDAFLEKLEHHTEIRDSKPNCARADEIVIENLEHFTEGLEEKKRRASKKKTKYNLPYYNDKSTLKRIIGTMNVNSFCANNNENKRIARCMFPIASLFAHSCAPNCSWTIQIPETENHINSSGKRRRKRKNGFVVRRKQMSSFKSPPEIQIYSAVSIKKGEHVTIPYSTRNIFYGTLKRQICMESVGHFICKCRRCMDVTELGTFMSSLLCFKCEKGFLVPIDASDEDSQWICSNSFKGSLENNDRRKNGVSEDGKSTSGNCDYKCSVGKVVYFTTKIQDKIDRVRGRDLDWFEEQEELQNIFENYFGRDLHANHYLLFEISTRMVELLDEKLVTTNGLCADLEALKITEEQRKILINRFLFHVKYMLNIANIILPGYNHYQDQIRLYLEDAESLKAAIFSTPQVDHLD